MWKDLTMSQRSDMMDLYLSKGITSLDDMRSLYDSSISDTAQGTSFSDGGSIHIKPENRGKFTALKERTGHSATWFKENGTPAQKKMATFALNARHWKHGYGGHIYDGTTEDTQQMSIPYAGELPDVTVMPRRIANKSWDKVQERWVGNMPTYYAINPETGKEEMLREIGNGKYSTYDDKHVFDVLAAETAKKQREQWVKNGGTAGDFDKVMLGTLGLGLAPIALPEIAAGVTAASGVVADAVAATPWGQTAIKALNTPFGKTAINTLLAYPGLNNFFSPEGYQKTANAFNEGRYGDAALSAVGDALDLSMAAPLAKNVYTTGKEIGKAINTAVENFRYPLGRAVKSPQITAENAASITPEQWTAAQDAAIARGDMAEAQRLRDLHFQTYASSPVISKNGTPLETYHTVSDKHDYHFNEFKPDIEGEHSGIFTTDSPIMSGSYAKKVVSKEEQDAIIEAIRQRELHHYDNYVSSDITNELRKKVYKIYSNPQKAKKQILKDHPFLNDIELGRQKKLYLNLNNPLIIDANGNSWNKIPLENLPESLLDYPVIDLNESIAKTASTRSVDKLLAGNVGFDRPKLSYDGAIFNNIWDYGPNKFVHPNFNKPATVFNVQSPNNIKLADAVTYDDKGVRIPLGERDNFNISDIRYGLIPFGIGLTGYGLYNSGNEK